MSRIIYKSKEQLRNLEESGKYLTELLYILYDYLKPGISGLDMEQKAQEYIDKHNLKWAFKGYHWFPANLCISVNDCVVHWIPNNYVFKEWDLVKIDAGILHKWMVSDAAFSKIVGWNQFNQLWYKLIKATKQALDAGVWTLKVGKSFYDMGKTIFNVMKKNGFSVIKTLTWHGVWVKVHEYPYLYNYPNPELKQHIVRNWMAFAVEPITAVESTDWVEQFPGDWPLYCAKGDLWAQWEYTLIVDNWKVKVVAWIQEDLFDK